MGYYLNPPVDLPKNPTLEDTTKASCARTSWCKENGVALDEPPVWEEIPFDCCAIAVIEAGLFEAAAIAYNRPEYDVLKNSANSTGRPIQWFLVKKEKVLPYSDITLWNFQ